MPQSLARNSGPTFEFAIRNDMDRRTIHVRMSGLWDEQAVAPALTALYEANARYHGEPHLVLTDVRGMTLRTHAAGTMIGESIRIVRARGVVLCVHLSDSTLMRLQASRIAREFSPGIDVTVDVGSYEEAERVLEEARARLDAGMPIL